MHPIKTAITLAALFASSTFAQPVVTAVVNRASYSALLSPNCYAIIAGYNFASTSISVKGDPTLPTSLGGVSVTVAGLPALLLTVSPTEVDALIPAQTAIPQNTVVPLVVTTAAGSGTYDIRLTRNAPSIFNRDDGSGLALVLDSNFQQIDTVGPQDTVIFYATGLGPTDASGRVMDPIEVYVGDRMAQVLFAGLAPGLLGIYQVNVTATAPATDRLFIRAGGWQSNIVRIGIPAGMNTANVQGTIDGLNPSSDPGYPTTPQRPCIGDEDPGPCGPMGNSESLPIILHAGIFTVSFDIVPGAGLFTVAAVGEAGGSIISIDPAAGSYTASVTTVAPPTKFGNFSTLIVPLWDYLSCDWKTAICSPFPNSVIPPSRLSPYLLKAVQQLPASNATAVTGPNASLQASGKLSGSHFAIDSQNNSTLSTFGGFVQVPYGPYDTAVSTFSLYVDGNLVATKELPYVLFQRAPFVFITDFSDDGN